MSKTEKYISEHTRHYSNSYWDKYDGDSEYPWLSPDDARKAVEIAREEIIEKTLDFLKDKLYNSGYIGIMDLCDEYIKIIKDE